MFKPVNYFRRLQSISLVLLVLCLLVPSSATANSAYGEPYRSIRQSGEQLLETVLQPRRLAQNKRSELRSRSEVVEEVKRRYNARVLRISLNRQQEIYDVRVLMPNGKVKNIKMSATR